MSATGELEAALRAYSARFDNLDELMHPALMERPDFVAFLQWAAEREEPTTRVDIEKELGPVSWDW